MWGFTLGCQLGGLVKPGRVAFLRARIAFKLTKNAPAAGIQRRCGKALFCHAEAYIPQRRRGCEKRSIYPAQQPARLP